MKLATTTGDFSHAVSTDIERLEHLYQAGFRYVDLSLYNGAREDWEYFQPDWKDRVLALKEFADAHGMKFVQSHAPGGNPMVYDARRDLLIRSTIRSIEICAMLGIPNTVVHTGWRDDVLYNAEGEKVYFEENRAFLRELFPAMEQFGVEVLIENSTKANMRDRYYFFTGDEMRRFIEFVDHPLVHACWDTGHANCEGEQYTHIVALGDELHALHVNDNFAKRDEHLMPFVGCINMDEVMCALTEIGYNGCFTFESSSTLTYPNYWLGRRREFAKDDRLFSPPLFLADGMEKLLYQTGEYILKSYDVFEE